MDNRDNRPVARRGSTEFQCGCGSLHDCGALMNQLQTIDFAIIETVLYLDSYPDSCEALQYYNQLLDKRRAVAQAYETQCGPITAFENGKAGEWRWVNGPWPWELGFPGNLSRR